MKNVLLALCPVIFILMSTSAQEMRGQGNASPIRIYGKVVDAKNNKGMEAVSVQLAIQSTDSSGNAKDSVIAGMFTRANGDFSFDNIVVPDSIQILISAIGYTAYRQKVSFGNKNAGAEKDLGNISVQQEANMLSNVTVTAAKPSLQMGIDRKVFSVEKSITATGGTAIDVMKNIPSVSVDVDGNVSLRNSTPQIFVDGRPTILTLDQIPADNIERVELITNPSAKFDAASTGGIINVVLKKNRRLGLNGTASLGGGVPDILNGNLTLNLRQNKFNFFVAGGYNQSGGKAKSETFRQNKNNGAIENSFNQVSINDRSRRFASVRFGFDYFMDNRNTITISQNFVKGKFTSDEEQSQQYFTAANFLDSTGQRLSDNNSSFTRSNTQFIFTHKFAKAGKQISADVNYNTGGGDDQTNITNYYFRPDGSQSAAPKRVRNFGDNDNDQWTFQIDYVNPTGDNEKFEGGIRTYINQYSSNFTALAVDGGGLEQKLSLSNYYKYREVVNALYGTYSNKIKSFAYQLGLRVETSSFDGELTEKGQKFGYDYPSKINNIWDALFPSIFLTQTIAEGQDIQVNYSRRIRRPNFWQLNPFIDINDPVNLRQGNPALRPEFTNSFEFNYNNTYNKGSFLAVIYYRNTLGDITQYSDTLSKAQLDQLEDAAVDPGARLNTFVNATSNNRLGAELTLQQTLFTNFEIVPTANLQYRKVNANIRNTNLSNEGFNWEAKLIVNYKIEAKKAGIFNNTSYQVMGEYESPEVIPQGKRKEQYSVDVAIRKDMFKGKKGSLTFAVNDVFNSNRWGSILDTESFYQDSYRRRNVRTFRATFSYRFGNANFNLFKRNGREDNDDNDGGGDSN